MKQISQFFSLVCITMMMISCASQNRIQLVGHYKPNIEVSKSQNVSHSTEIEMQSIPSVNDPQLSATTMEATPEIKPLMETLRQAVSSSETHELNSARFAKLEKKLNKLEKKLQVQSEQGLSNQVASTHQKKSSGAVSKVLLIILCFLLPPLAVGLAKGIGWPFWLSLILTLCFWLPGVIYALIVILGDGGGSSSLLPFEKNEA